MKTKMLIMLALSAMIFLGCSRDALDDPMIEAADLEMNLNDENTKMDRMTLAIQMKGYGTMEVVKPFSCMRLDQINMEGVSKELSLGEFKTTITNCTNFLDEDYLKGRHFTATGELYFYSEKFHEDKESKWYAIYFDGGTGKFQGAVGEMKIYIDGKWDDALRGTYSYYGDGYLEFVK